MNILQLFWTQFNSDLLKEFRIRLSFRRIYLYIRYIKQIIKDVFFFSEIEIYEYICKIYEMSIMSDTAQKGSDKKIYPLRTRRRFRLSFINENTFNEVWTVKLSLRKVVALVALLIAALASMVATIIVFTPLRTLLPGYLKQSQRQENIVNSMRIDSLATQLNIIDAYYGNFKSILADSALRTAAGSVSENTMNPDSLIPASESELKFLKRYEESNRYNVDVLSSTATDGIFLHNPLPSGIARTSADNFSVELIVPSRSPILAVSGGSVIDMYNTYGKGWTIVIQHTNGLLSKYEGLSRTFVSTGSKVDSGASIGLIEQAGEKNGGILTFEIWHKGTMLNPCEFLHWK